MKTSFIKTTIFKLLCFILTILISSCSEKRSTADPLKDLDANVEKLLQDYHAAGLAIAVVKDGKTIYSKGFGYRNYEKQALVDENTIFGIGSCSKSFTATLFGILADKGAIHLKDAPSKYIPELEFNTKTMDSEIQLHHLLSHTTGISDRSSESSAVLFSSNDKESIIPRFKHLKSISNPGEEFIYNNLVYALAGRITEHITHKNWQENLSEMIFDPLQMTHTFGNVVPASKNPNFSFGYTVDSITPLRVLPENIPTRDASGNIYSSVKDMAKWMHVWLNKGKWGNEQLFSEKYLEEATSSIAQLKSNPDDTSARAPRYYGYGWFNRDHNGHKRIEHSGGVSGYTSNMVLYPENQLGIIVLSNQTRSSLPFAITNEIISKLLPELTEDPFPIDYSQKTTTAPADTPTVLNSKKPPSHNLSAFQGIYEHPGFGSIEVSFQKETLYAKFPFTTFRLVHRENNLFIDYNTEEIPQVYWNFMELTFREDASGEIDQLLLNVDYEAVVFLKN